MVIYHPGGLPVIVETEFAPASTVGEDARKRLGKKLKRTGEIVEQAIALRVPEALKQKRGLNEAIRTSQFELRVYFSEENKKTHWPQQGWVKVNVDGLASAIELASLSENRIRKSMKILMQGVEQAANNLRAVGKEAPDMLESIARKLYQKDGKQTSRMAMSIIVNALTFHRAVAQNHGIETIEQIRDQDENRVLSQKIILDVWNRVCREVNYIPIFRLAADLLVEINNGTALTILERLDGVASKLAKHGATSQHDLNGRILQRLIVDRKYLATFYTRAESARLLAELALARLKVDWTNGDAISNLRFADFACGTGALLSSSYAVAMSRYRRSGKDDKSLHPQMMEKVLVGTDIMPVAMHLTASVLASAHPNESFSTTSIATLPYGKQPTERGGHNAIGALELIEEEDPLPLFDSGRQQQRIKGSEEGSSDKLHLPHESFDLVIMNPPFTRSSGSVPNRSKIPRPAFAGFETSEDEQKKMASRLKEIVPSNSGMAGNGHAGLASYFIDLAHVKLKDNGVLALVLPEAFASGQSWSKARKFLLEGNYRDICIIGLLETGTYTRAFSADTGMGEVLVIATKGGGREETSHLH